MVRKEAQIYLTWKAQEIQPKCSKVLREDYQRNTFFTLQANKGNMHHIRKESFTIQEKKEMEK